MNAWLRGRAHVYERDILEIGLVEEALDTGATDGCGAASREPDRHALLEGPAGECAVWRLRQGARDSHDVDTCRGGNGPWVSRAERVLETGEAQGQIAPSPFAHGEVGTPPLPAKV